jgi:tetratricopeptide (TPR) repeat protein
MPQADRNPAEARPPGWAGLGVVAALAAVVAAIYGQVARNQFVSLDDDVYVLANKIVARGLSRDGLVWAFTHFHAANWHPLTWLSHMLDCQLFGATQQAAGAHHLVSVGLHAASAILLFLSLRRMTGALWPSAFVSGLFAVHPLRVESVAWASERKDVLSGFFFMLTLLAYARYAKRPRVGAYLCVLGSALLGLLSKPMLVTLPFVLLLLDFWPLHRWSFRASPPHHGRRGASSGSPAPGPWPLRRLLLEKAPLFLAAAGVGLMTVRAQETGGAVSNLETIPFAWRVVTAAIAYVTYLWKTLWPSSLAPLYIHPATLRSADIKGFVVPSVAAILFLAIVTAVVVRSARLRPYCLTGWLWFLGMLVPVIGLTQVGVQSWADRYAYLPLVGAYIMVAWGVGDLVARRPQLRVSAGVAALASLLAYGAAAHAQVRMWHDSRRLFEHSLRVTSNNWLIENNLGAVLAFSDPKSDEARRHFEEALRVNPNFPDTHSNLAAVLWNQGARAEARRHWEAALALRPDHPAARIGLGAFLAREGKFAEARREFELVLRLDPTNADAHNNLADALLAQGLRAEAGRHWDATLRLQPDNVRARIGQGNLRAKEGKIEEARVLLEQAVSLEPKNADAHANLGMLLAGSGKLDEAHAHLEEALRLDPRSALAQHALARWLATAPDPLKRDPKRALKLAHEAATQTEFRRPEMLATLAAAYAAAGDFRQAVVWQQRVLELTPEADRAGPSARLRLYQAGRPLTSGAAEPAADVKKQ